MSDSSSEDDVPLASLTQKPAAAAVPKKPAPKRPAPSSSESGEESDEPVKKPAAKKKAAPKRPAPSSSSESGEESDEPVKKPAAKKKPPARRASKPTPKRKAPSSDDDDDSDSSDSDGSEESAPKKPARKKAAPRAKKEAAPRKRAPRKSTGEKKPKAPKQLTRLQRLEQGIGAFEWWNAPNPPEGKAWTTLEHAGCTFEPQYQPHGVPLLFNGEPVTLTPRQEELATFYAAMPEDGPQLSKTGGQREIFQKNFWDDFSNALGSGHAVKNFKGCDFSRITEHLDRQKAIKRSASDAEKLSAKEEKDRMMLKSGFALLDGHVEKLGNFRMEPPSLFRGRGKHPKTGTVKQRTEPDMVTVNVGRDRPPPVCLEPGRAWKEVQHDDSVTWMATWHENVMKATKYVMLAANSSLKGKSDYNKFAKALQLKGSIASVRRDYRAQLDSSDRFARQQATTMWLIDVLALRVGGEKSEEEADTVGCCSLRAEHFTFHDGGKDVDLEFLGKDSIRFKQSIDFAAFDVHGQKVYDNLVKFCKGKRPQEQVFELVEPTVLNQHLQTIMPGLTAKVFRTYNASETLQEQLPKAEDVKKLETPGEKVVAYNEANRKVAILCNHQRTVSNAAAATLSQNAARLEQLKDQRRELQQMKKALDAGKSGKKDVTLHSGEDPAKEAGEAVAAAKELKNTAKTADEKVAASKAYEEAMEKRRNANKEKQAEAHRFRTMPDSDQVGKRIKAWAEKITKMETDVRNKEDNKEVSLGTSKANYMDPRITVAWCKRCELPIERLFPKTLKDKFNWSLQVPGEWRFDAGIPESEFRT